MPGLDASWFAASEVTLRRDEPQGLVVKAEKGCLGANIDPFWVFRRTSDGYDLVLSESALYLKVLNTRTNDYRDIELSAVVEAGKYVVYLKYKFRNGMYRLSSRRSVLANP